MIEIFDVIVVGGGTAGCIVAARLSEDADCSVLLLEAGEDYATSESVPPVVHDARYVPMRGHAPEFIPDHDWGLNAQGHHGAKIAVPQARLIGGGSAINGMISLRGATADYREWEKLGNPQWSWEHVLPAFRALEKDAVPDPAIHGHDGPVTISRFDESAYAPLQKAFVDACRTVGIRDAFDLNAPDAHGVGPAPMTRIDNRRISTAESYLDAARNRPNLTVRGSTLVDRVTFDGMKATGIELDDGTAIEAREVVLAAGAIITPAILQRSGIGPVEVLSAVGVPAVVHLPVGHNLGDHFAVPLLAAPKDDAWCPDDYSLQTVARMSSSAQPGSLDGQLTMFSYLNVRTTGEGIRGLAGDGSDGLENVAGIGCVLNKPRSVGTVSVVSRNPGDLPSVDPNYLAEQIDREAIREIVRLGWAVLTSEPLRSMLDQPIGLDAHTIGDDAALDAVIESKTASGYHLTGTCKMAERAQGGVVDQEGRVYGVSHLRVADASVIPTTPAANSMLTTIMVSERIAAFARGRAFPYSETDRGAAAVDVADNVEEVGVA